jgi:hypothetical protein
MPDDRKLVRRADPEEKQERTRAVLSRSSREGATCADRKVERLHPRSATVRTMSRSPGGMDDLTDTTPLPPISHFIFLYANAEGSCTLCDGDQHLIAACCFEAHVGTRRLVYNGIEVCPACLERKGPEAGPQAIRTVCRQMVAAYARPRTRLARRNLREARAYSAHLMAVAERGGCRLPPKLLSRWIAREK